MAVPLIFELIFVGLLFFMLERTEKLLDEEKRSTQIVSTANEMSKSFFDSGYALVGWNYTKSAVFKTQFEQCTKAIPKGLAVLKKLTAGNKRQEAHYQKLEKASKEVLAELGKQGRNIEAAEERYNMNFGAYRSKLNDVFAPFITELRELSKEESRRVKEAPEATKKSRRDLRLYLTAGIAFNVFLALALAVYFSNEISKRLQVMISNTEKFKNKEALSIPVRGSDEVAQLDRVFHEMADALAVADQRKQEFISMISHDLRTPLNSVQGTLELLLRGSYGQLTEKGQKRVADAEEESERILTLINELLDLEKLEAGMMDLDFTSCESGEIISRAMSALESIAEKKGIKFENASESYELVCDQKRILQVLINLISNALKFSPENDSILISSSIKNNEEIEFRVTDHGPGIEPEYRERIFDRFQQVKGSSKGGTGLGLSICKALVAGHRGSIGLDCEPGKTCSFWFRLPIKQKSKRAETA